MAAVYKMYEDRMHANNASTDAALVLSEARSLNQRDGFTIDYGALYHYLAWVHLRSKEGRRSLPYYALAIAHGNFGPPMADLWWKLRQHLRIEGLHSPGERRRRAQRGEWRSAAEAWLNNVH